MELQAAGRNPSGFHQKLQGGWHLGLEMMDRSPLKLLCWNTNNGRLHFEAGILN